MSVPQFRSENPAAGFAGHPVLTRLRRRLAHYRRQRIQTAFVRGVIETLCLQLFILPVLGWISAGHPYDPRWLKFLLGTYVLYLWPFLRALQARFQAGHRWERVAKRLDQAHPGSPDIFRTLLSLGNHTPEMLTKLDAFYGEWEGHLQSVPPVWMGTSRRRGLAVAVLFCLTLPLFSHHFGEVAYRMTLPGRVLGNISVPRLKALAIPERVVLGDTLRASVVVENLPASEPVYALLLSHGQEERYSLERTGDTARFLNGPVNGDLALRFSALGVETSEFEVHAVPPPSFASFSAIVEPPAYTHLPPESLAEVPAVFTALPGSRIAWRARSGVALQKVVALFKNSGAASSDTDFLGGGRNFSVRREVRSATELSLRLFTEDSLSGVAGPYRVEKGIDAPPEISILSPQDNGDLGRSLKLPMVFRAHDDFGISGVTLHYSVLEDGKNISQGTEDVLAWLKPASEVGEGEWEMGNLPLKPGDVLEIYLAAADNDAVSGPQTARSATVRLRMPSLEEVVSGMEAGEHGALTSLKSAAEREEQVRSNSEKMISQAPANALPPVSPWEVRRILNAAPEDHLERLERHLEAEAAQVNRESPLGKQLESLRSETKEMEKHLPPPDAYKQPLPEQKRWLDSLMRSQEKLQDRLSKLEDLKTAPPSKSSPISSSQQKEALAQERKALQDELQHNRQDQKDLGSWLQDQQQQLNTQKQTLDASQQAEQRAREDVQQALSQMQQTLQKGMENGALSPDLLEKMQRIQELLKEALPDSTLSRLRQQAENQQVGMEDLQRSVKDLMDQKQDTRQGLDRAIRMLEMLRDMHTLENLSKDLHALESEEDKLADDLGKDQGKQDRGSPDQGREEGKDNPDQTAKDLQSRQSDLRQRLEENRQELSKLAEDEKAFKELKSGENEEQAHEAQEKMQAAENALKPSSPDKPKAQKHAKAAAKALKQMAANMDNMLGRMQGGPDAADVAAVLDETLEFGRWLDLIRNPTERRRAGWEEETPALNQRADQLAHWLRGRMESLALRRPFESEVLRREAAEMSFQADALLTVSLQPGYPPSTDSLRVHTRLAARELLKWLQHVQQEGSGSDGSEGGDENGSAGSGGQGQGQGQGEGDEEGLDGLAGRLRGVSGKQMAVNEATYQLLRSMLEGRHGGAGSQGSPMPFPGGSSGSSSMPGAEGSQGSGDNGSTGGSQGGNQNGSPGNQNGGSGNSGGQGGNSSQGSGSAANAQQGIGESLERMAESASDAGGAARKLRELAAQARDLEKDLREGRLTPEEVRQRQDRFQTRLLEATNAMEERGQERQRQAEAYKGGPLKTDSTQVSAGADVFAELRRRQEEARGLALPPEQKRRIESYYETLLSH